MKIKQTIVSLALLIGIGSFAAAPIASADCGGVKTSIVNCNETGGEDVNNSGVLGILKLVINIMTAGVGILAVGGIVYGSILYTSAGASSEQTKKAISIITNVVVGLIVYALMYAITSFLIPGGLFG
ncbi:hypothetical protein D3C85_848350 [compost metagenome]